MTITLVSTNTVGNNGVKALIHGAAKVGKTLLAATCPAPIILSAERGLLSLRKHNLPYINIDTFKSFKEARQWVMTSKEARQFQTIFIDSVTELGELLLKESSTKDGRQRYGEMQDELSALLRDFRDLIGPHVVFIMQSEFYTDAALGTAVYIPTIPGQALKQKLAYLTDEVFYMHMTKDASGNPIRALRTQPDYRTVAGDRSGVLAEIEPAHLGNIFDKITKQ